MSYTPDKPPSKSATSFRGSGPGIGLGVLASMMEPLASGEGGFSLSPRSIPIISLIKAAANFSLDGDKMPSESSSSSDQLICEPLQETDMMSRLSNLFIARDEILIKNFVLSCSGQGRTYNPMLPKVLPFPVETCTLDDLIKFHALQNLNGDESYESMGPEDNADLILLILKDFIFKLWGLHFSGVTHGNLAPQNVLIVEGECVLESTLNDDFKSLEWNAPEQFSYSTSTKASDMFAFGCILYFCITKGSHPFGDQQQRILNITTNQCDISGVNNYPESYSLISCLLNPDPKLRPKAHQLIGHPLFMSLRTKLKYMKLICEDIFSSKICGVFNFKIPMFVDENCRTRLLEFFSKYCLSHEQPFEKYKDIFGQRGSPSFFPTVFMEMMDVAIKFRILQRDYKYYEERRLSEDEYLYVKQVFGRPAVYESYGPWW